MYDSFCSLLPCLLSICSSQFKCFLSSSTIFWLSADSFFFLCILARKITHTSDLRSLICAASSFFSLIRRVSFPERKFRVAVTYAAVIERHFWLHFYHFPSLFHIVGYVYVYVQCFLYIYIYFIKTFHIQGTIRHFPSNMAIYSSFHSLAEFFTYAVLLFLFL